MGQIHSKKGSKKQTRKDKHTHTPIAVGTNPNSFSTSSALALAVLLELASKIVKDAQMRKESERGGLWVNIDEINMECDVTLE